MTRSLCILVAIAATAFQITGCSAPPPPQTGFVSDYSSLTTVREGWMRYISPELSDYTKFMIDPVEIRVDRDLLTPEERAELAQYMREGFERAIRGGGLTVTDQPGVGVARVRFAITDIDKATWWMSIHPASKLTGAGAGSAAMEGEVIDSVTGQQLAAVVRSDKGNQFEIDTFSGVDDLKDAIDKWSESAAERLQELREEE